MFKLLIISLLTSCAGDSDISSVSSDISTLFAENREDLQLLLFIAPGDPRAEVLIQASAVDSIDMHQHDVAFEPTMALQAGIASNGFGVLSRRPTAALPSPPNTIFPLSGDLSGRVGTALRSMTIPQKSAFFVAGEDGLTFDSDEPSNRNQRLAALLRQQGVAVYFEMPAEINDDEISEAPEDNLLVITGRPSTIPVSIIRLAGQHLMHGGPLLVAVEPEAHSGDFQELGTALGVQFGTGTLVSEEGLVRGDIGGSSPQDRQNHATSEFLAHDSNPHLSARTSSSAKLLFSGSSWILPATGSTTTFSPTVLSNHAAFGDLNGNSTQDEDETSGALVLAGVSVGSPVSPYRAVILSDSTMISDRWLLHPTNSIFTKDLIRWLLPNNDPIIGSGTAQDNELEVEVNAEASTPLFTEERIRSIQLRDPRRSVLAVMQRDEYGAFSTVTSDGARGVQSFRGSREIDRFGEEDYTLNYIRRWEEQSEEKLEEFGFGQNNRSLAIQLTSGTSYGFELGARNNKLKATYALDLESHEIYLIQYDDYSHLAQPTRTLRDSRFHGELDWQLIQITVSGRPITIERLGESWVTSESQADNTAVTEWAQEVFRLRAMPNQFDHDSVEEIISFYITSDSGIINNVQLGKALSEDGNLVTVGRSSHTREWVGLPPSTADLVVSTPTILQAIEQ